MLLVVVWKNTKPFKIDIDDSKTILELKTQIAKHFNGTDTGFNIINGIDIIDSSQNNKSISACRLKRMIRLPDNYKPGDLNEILI